MSRFLVQLSAALLLVLLGTARAADSAPDASGSSATAPSNSTPSVSINTPTGAPATTDPSYLLISGDTITISVYEEPELTTTQTIGHAGEIRLPLVGDLVLSTKTVREAEHFIEQTYIKKELLKAPVVSIVVTSYFPREVSVLGAVRSPGTVVFPRDVTSLDIVDVITRVGGFLPISKSDAVTVTHKGADGKETVTTIDLESTITGRRRAGRDRADLAIYPGDRIWVPERLF